MKRALAWAGVIAAIVAGAAVGAAAVQHLYSDREYRRLLASGDQALASGNAYAAVEAFSGALAFRPDSMVAFLRRGEAYRDQRRFDEAIRDWRQANRLAPDAPQPLVALGDHFDAVGQPAAAAEWYTQAAERLRAEDPGLLYRLALARFKAGDSASAVEPLKTAVARNPASAEFRYLLGLVQRDAGDAENALTTLESAIRLAPDLIVAREELADLYRAVGRPIDEMTQLQELAARDPQVARRVAVADAEIRGGQTVGALSTLTAALQAAPNDSRILLAIGRVYLTRAERQRGQDPESAERAIEVIERALGGSAPRGAGLALYGRALFVSGNVVDAERILKDAVATSPIETEAFQYLADSAEQLGHHVVARDALLSLISSRGTPPAAPCGHRGPRALARSRWARGMRPGLPTISRALSPPAIPPRSCSAGWHTRGG
jgi:tetratricopeptide (TPR) repeat protein